MSQCLYNSLLTSAQKQLFRQQLQIIKQTLPDRPVLLLLEGNDATEKNQIASLLRSLEDGHIFQLISYPKQIDITRKCGKFMADVPAKGTCALFVNSWYTPFLQKKKTLSKETVDFIKQFETYLTENGIFLFKAWIQTSDRTFLSEKKTKIHIDSVSDSLSKRNESFLQKTENWHFIHGNNYPERIDSLLKSICSELNQKPCPKSNSASETLFLSRKDKKIIDLTNKFHTLLNRLFARNKKVILIMEGPDAAGKGGFISTVTSRFPVKKYKIIPISAPTDEEKSHPYLWRFTRALTESRELTVFDRSWYGRVLVERIEHFATETEWERAYREINLWEDYLQKNNFILIKLFLDISKPEQLKRFKQREGNPVTRWKLTSEDWRNRKNWTSYQQAVKDMIHRTNSPEWIYVLCDKKKDSRIHSLKSVCKKLENYL